MAGLLQMAESQARTVNVPGIPTTQPATLAVALSDRAMRVMVDNIGAVPIRVSFATASLSGLVSAGSDHYTILVGQSRVFILSPNQRLYASAVGAIGTMSVHTSDALPFQPV